MKEIVLDGKNDSVVYLVGHVLQGYCEAVYNLSVNEPEMAINFLLGEKHSEMLYDVLIAQAIEAHRNYDSNNGLSGINFNQIREVILYWHKEHVIDLVLKNIKQDEADGPVYWKLKMTVSRH